MAASRKTNFFIAAWTKNGSKYSTDIIAPCQFWAGLSKHREMRRLSHWNLAARAKFNHVQRCRIFTASFGIESTKSHQRVSAYDCIGVIPDPFSHPGPGRCEKLGFQEARGVTIRHKAGSERLQQRHPAREYFNVTPENKILVGPVLIKPREQSAVSHYCEIILSRLGHE